MSEHFSPKLCKEKLPPAMYWGYLYQVNWGCLHSLPGVFAQIIGTGLAWLGPELLPGYTDARATIHAQVLTQHLLGT